MSKQNLIRTIYLYVFSGVGLSLFIIGVFMGVRYLVNTTQYPEYPLQTYEETRCNNYPYSDMSRPMPAPDTKVASPSAAEMKQQEETCKEQLEADRKHRKIDDLTQSLAFLIIGALVFIPHWKMARKSS